MLSSLLRPRRCRGAGRLVEWQVKGAAEILLVFGPASSLLLVKTSDIWRSRMLSALSASSLAAAANRAELIMDILDDDDAANEACTEQPWNKHRLHGWGVKHQKLHVALHENPTTCTVSLATRHNSKQAGKYAIYLPRRLSWPRWLIIHQDGSPFQWQYLSKHWLGWVRGNYIDWMQQVNHSNRKDINKQYNSKFHRVPVTNKSRSADAS